MIQKVFEGERGCGSRKAGKDGVGIYLRGIGLWENCERLPFSLKKCSCCGQPFRQGRGFTEIHPALVFDAHKEPCCDPTIKPHHHDSCLVCTPARNTGWLMWVGAKHYTTKSFMVEAMKFGISKRAGRLPVELEVGDPVYLAHPYAIGDEFPGIFTAFTLSHIDLVLDHDITEDNLPDRALAILDKYGDANVQLLHVYSPQLELAL